MLAIYSLSGPFVGLQGGHRLTSRCGVVVLSTFQLIGRGCKSPLNSFFGDWTADVDIGIVHRSGRFLEVCHDGQLDAKLRSQLTPL